METENTVKKLHYISPEVLRGIAMGPLTQLSEPPIRALFFHMLTEQVQQYSLFLSFFFFPQS
jgi:hypothetical protein